MRLPALLHSTFHSRRVVLGWRTGSELFGLKISFVTSKPSQILLKANLTAKKGIEVHAAVSLPMEGAGDIGNANLEVVTIPMSNLDVTNNVGKGLCEVLIKCAYRVPWRGIARHTLVMARLGPPDNHTDTPPPLPEGANHLVVGVMQDDFRSHQNHHKPLISRGHRTMEA